MSNEHILDIQKIMEMLPHRYPFLLVDRVLELEPGVRLKAIKNVTMNEEYFQGHFPNMPVMPGVLQLEALAQAGGILVINSIDEPLGDKVFLFTGLNKVKFRRPVVPGDQLELCVHYERHKLNIWKMRGVAKVDGQVTCQGEFSAAIADKGVM
ncbi:3-hydroxyacyl-[acyl-carrier-protein] dehydratase FabZ [Pseudodesulfovibrio nedwellii]|uniref:3-hydroxyacyl-[acyl-carrier-protein] dehydratase FabZ n=1 Tax=Pseudodesulfovibrio nedwellii TaxID=2973072 RepID=A0ABN6S3C2_9BACT|nr:MULTISPECIES: 3-hydroxyacyl-ACP dehydratase FabZ [Pseudodesulfovibrio]BDQ36438.1 3-hydroxyacyl-[acyl-carrier-protein] dehydratase FabZ [Pseudodesulfovibrio nedwellii]